MSLIPFALSGFGGALYFLGFPGFDLWPLALIALVPLFTALEWERDIRPRRALLLGTVFGSVACPGGYYWLFDMLEKFSGFGSGLNLLFASLFWLFQAGLAALFAWLWVRGRENGWSTTAMAVAAFATCEQLYPFLFPNYAANCLHEVPILLQIVDLGGPILLSAMIVGINGALYELGKALILKHGIPRTCLAIVTAGLIFSLAYGGYRISEVEKAEAKAPKLTVGIVQTNMGLFEKRTDPFEGLRRHVTQTLRLEKQVKLDLVVWPESAYTFFIPSGVENVKEVVMGPVHTPLLFGGLARREEGHETRHYNTAYLVNRDGRILGTYDKTYLLAFGEYLPFGDFFPSLYDLSPHTGHFTPGNHQRPLKLDSWRITTLVCYEDVLPRFVRTAVQKGSPHLLVNITNDAWFGDTTEPWIHLALAKLRAVEHHRYLVRATNSGVSAVIDPVGRVVTRSGVFSRENLHAKVALLQTKTVYEKLGDWPGWLGCLATLGMAFFKRRPSVKR